MLDASALLALLFGERGGEMVAPLLGRSSMSTVNLAEVLGRFARDGHAVEQVLARLSATPIEWVDFDEIAAARAASLLPVTRASGLSLGDRACLALAMERGVPAVTADESWLGLDVGVEVRCIRARG